MTEFADWTRAFVMMGDSPVGIREVLLGADGSLYALLQGETIDEELRTVRLDDEGRMSAFVIDSVDAWNRMLSIGNAELAARLGSSVNYDRRGQVLFVESFEKGWYKWIPSLSGDGAAAAITPVAAASGGYCVKLTGGDDDDQYACIERYSTSRPVGRMGLEFSFALPGSWLQVFAEAYIYTGAFELYAAVTFDQTTGNLKVNDHLLGYTVVGTGKALAANMKAFNTLKLVANVDTLEYVRLMFNQQEIDISARTVVTEVDILTAPSARIKIRIYSRVDNNDVMYLDDVIWTAGEPE